MNPLRIDPTRTTPIVKAWVRDLQTRARQLQADVFQHVVTDDVFGIAPHVNPLKMNAEKNAYIFKTDPEKVRAFQGWFQEKIDAGILKVDGDGKPWTAKYTQSAYKQGVVRAYTDTHADALKDKTAATGESKALFLQKAFGAPERTKKIEMIYTRSFESLKGYTAEMAAKTSRILADGIANGSSPASIAKQMKDQIAEFAAMGKKGKYRAMTIARTELVHAHAEGQLDSFAEMGVHGVGVMAEWSTAGDDRVCPLCAPMEGRLYPLKEARGMIPRHPNCVVGESVVFAPGAIAMLQTHYTGQILDFVTMGGRCVSVTPAHVLLTEYGFARAEFLHKGMNLVVDAGVDFTKTPNDKTNVPCIAEEFVAAGKSAGVLSVCVPTSPEDLHNEGRSCNPEINIVFSNGVLGNGEQPQGGQPGGYFGFPFCQRGVDRAALRAVAQFLERVAFAFDRSMGGLRDALAFFLGRILEADSISFRPGAGRDTVIPKAFFNSSSRNAEVLRHLQHGNAFVEHLQQFGNVDVAAILSAPRLDSAPGFLQTVFQRVPLDTVLRGDAVNRPFADCVQLDKIVDVRYRHVENLPVYDVQTTSTMYVVGGVLSSNCRCAWIPGATKIGKKGKSKAVDPLTKITEPSTGVFKTTAILDAQLKSKMDAAQDTAGKTYKQIMADFEKKMAAMDKDAKALVAKGKSPQQMLDGFTGKMQAKEASLKAKAAAGATLPTPKAAETLSGAGKATPAPVTLPTPKPFVAPKPAKTEIPAMKPAPVPVVKPVAANPVAAVAPEKPASPYGDYELVNAHIGGSTGSVMVKDAGGQEWVMKGLRLDPQQVANEAVANSIYAATLKGKSIVPVTKLETVNGKTVLLSKKLDGELKNLGDAFTKENIKEAQQGFVVDAWLGNWDAVGLSKDNMIITSKGLARIDQGGALLFRAQGSPKGSAFGDVVNELSTMRDKNKNPAAASVFGKLSDKDVVNQIAALEKTITEAGGISKFLLKHVGESAYSPANQDIVGDTLQKRYQNLLAWKVDTEIRLAADAAKATATKATGARVAVADCIRDKYEMTKVLKDTQRKHITKFTGSAYGKVNRATVLAVETGKPLPAAAKSIQAGLKAMPRLEGWTFRGVAHIPDVAGQFERYQTGAWAHVKWKAFSSTSIDPNHAFRHDHGFLYCIKNKGTRNVGGFVEAISQVRSEREYLLGYGAEFKVVGTASREIGGRTQRMVILEELDAKEVLPDKQSPPPVYDWDEFLGGKQKEFDDTEAAINAAK